MTVLRRSSRAAVMVVCVLSFGVGAVVHGRAPPEQLSGPRLAIALRREPVFEKSLRPRRWTPRRNPFARSERRESRHVANPAANRRFTFGVHGRGRALRDQLGGMLAFAVALLVTNSAIVALHVLAPAAPRSIEVATLFAANLLATFLRFVLLRAWIAGGRTYQMEDLRGPALCPDLRGSR